MKELKNLSVCEKLETLLYTENFISVVNDDIIEIEESNVEAGEDKLKKIIIKDIPHNKEGQIIWRINFEEYITGLSKIERTSTVETVLAILEDSVLNICLIEMKTMIKEKRDKSTLLNLKRKIEDSISRFYYLLCMGIPLKPGECKQVGINVDWEKFNNSQTKFCGVVCYNKERTKNYVERRETQRMYEILKGRARNNLILCDSNLTRLNIPLKFFKGSGEFFEIKFQEIRKLFGHKHR